MVWQSCLLGELQVSSVPANAISLLCVVLGSSDSAYIVELLCLYFYHAVLLSIVHM